MKPEADDWELGGSGTLGAQCESQYERGYERENMHI